MSKASAIINPYVFGGIDGMLVPKIELTKSQIEA